MSTNSPPTSPVSSASGGSTSAARRPPANCRQHRPGQYVPDTPPPSAHHTSYKRRERRGDCPGRRRLLCITLRATTVIGGEGSAPRSGRLPPRRAKATTCHRCSRSTVATCTRSGQAIGTVPSVRIQRRRAEQREDLRERLPSRPGCWLALARPTVALSWLYTMAMPVLSMLLASSIRPPMAARLLGGQVNVFRAGQIICRHGLRAGPAGRAR